MMELLSPAGDLEKLAAVYRYGADAAYIGVGDFSLRQTPVHRGAPEELGATLQDLKGGRKLYGALNVYFRPNDIRRLQEALDHVAALPFDALIVSDIGVVDILRRRLPAVELHLSTQANCTNAAAARRYLEMGFSRAVLARELSLDEIASIKAQVPGLEIEAFAHGAMCMAYSGRCILSAWLAGRSGNQGACAHTCRWNYRLALEEEKRPGEYLPIVEGDEFTQILSPQDLMMVRHLQELDDAGVDCIKIEGRMKSAYYAAMVTRGYRKELDRLAAGEAPATTEAYLQELYTVSHRPYSTGFYFADPHAQAPAPVAYRRSHLFLATVGRQIAPGRFSLSVKNGFSRSTGIEFVGPDLPCAPDTSFALFDPRGEPVDRITHQDGGSIAPSVAVEPGFMIRTINPTDDDDGLDVQERSTPR